MTTVMTPLVFYRELERCKPGQGIEYYRGHLAVDRVSVAVLDHRIIWMPDPQLDAIAEAALEAYESGAVHLVQLRHGAGDYSYYAIKRARRKPHAILSRSRARGPVSGSIAELVARD